MDDLLEFRVKLLIGPTAYYYHLPLTETEAQVLVKLSQAMEDFIDIPSDPALRLEMYQGGAILPYPPEPVKKRPRRRRSTHG